MSQVGLEWYLKSEINFELFRMGMIEGIFNKFVSVPVDKLDDDEKIFFNNGVTLGKARREQVYKDGYYLLEVGLLVELLQDKYCYFCDDLGIDFLTSVEKLVKVPVELLQKYGLGNDTKGDN